MVHKLKSLPHCGSRLMKVEITEFSLLLIVKQNQFSHILMMSYSVESNAQTFW